DWGSDGICDNEVHGLLVQAVAAGSLINLATILYLNSIRVPAVAAYVICAFFSFQVLIGIIKVKRFDQRERMVKKWKEYEIWVHLVGKRSEERFIIFHKQRQICCYEHMNRIVTGRLTGKLKSIVFPAPNWQRKTKEN
ncbi:hypothetical protein Gotur_025228, partial [Gossypium turneri]